MEDSNENFDKIKVFSSEDEKLKILGELLSNKSSRDIIRLLIEKEMYTNEIAKKLELRTNLVIHHLQKMEAIGLLEITNKKITRKGEEHRFFRIPQGMVIVPNEKIIIKKNRFLKKIFRAGIKFASIGLAGIVSFFISNSLLTIDKWSSPYQSNSEEILTSVIIGLIVIIIGLIIYIKLKK